MLGFAAHHLLPGIGDDIELVPRQIHGKQGRGGIADSQPCPVSGNPAPVRDPHTGGGAVPGEDHVPAEIGLGQVGQFAVTGLEGPDVVQLELLGDIADPAGAEALPGQQINAPSA